MDMKVMREWPRVIVLGGILLGGGGMTRASVDA